MRILWIVNLIPVEASKELGFDNEVLGGWVESMAKQLRKKQDIELTIVCKSYAVACHSK